jgi:hypothetical protein
MAAMLLQTSIGMSLLAAAGLVISLTPICIFFYLVQKGLGYHDFAAIAILLFFSTWFIAYRNPTIAQRKMPLIIVVIFWTSICNTPNGLLPSTFAFQLLEAMVIGLAVALAASLVVFPTSACYEIHQRLVYCLHGVEQASELVITAFVCHCQPSSADSGCEQCQVRRLRATADLDIVIALLRDTRAAMRVFVIATKGEFVPVLQRLTGLPLTPAQRRIELSGPALSNEQTRRRQGLMQKLTRRGRRTRILDGLTTLGSLKPATCSPSNRRGRGGALCSPAHSACTDHIGS